MRCQRVMISISVWLSMCPMCKRPVTLGGGSNIVKIGLAACGEPGTGVSTEKLFSVEPPVTGSTQAAMNIYTIMLTPSNVTTLLPTGNIQYQTEIHIITSWLR